MAVIESYLYYPGFVLAVLGFVWYLRRSLSFHVLQRICAWKVNKNESYLNEVLKREKVEVFQFLREYNERINKNLTILDDGSGPAANIAFLPQNTKLVCLDQNPHFKGYINRKSKKYENIAEMEFVQGHAENMPFESNLFDAAICTLVMCGVSDIRKSLGEIKRILKPGGKLFFLEHVNIEDERLWMCVLKCAWSPFGRLLYGCHLFRENDKHIKDAGFSDVHMLYVCPIAAPLSLRKCIIGVVTK